MKEREAHEQAAGMNLENSFFSMNSIDPNKPVLHVSRRDRRIIIELQDDDDCDAVIATGVPVLIRMGNERKEELQKERERIEICTKWWNTEIIPYLINLELSELSKLSDHYLWTWTQLVMQEMRYWVSVGNVVYNHEIEFIVNRRGFDEQQKTTLIDGLTRVGLYGGESNKIPDLDLDNAYSRCKAEDKVFAPNKLRLGKK